MADKQISQLVAATTINNDDLFVMQQGGTAKKLSGQKLSDFVYQSAADQIERVNEAVEQTQAAVDSLEEQKNEIAQTIADMAQYGTDTTLSTTGVAADAKATGDRIGAVEVEALASLEQAEITGVSIASFDHGADDVPVKSLIVNIDCVQTGSGDPSPENVRPITGWTAAKVTRAGKNLFYYDENNMYSVPNDQGQSRGCYRLGLSGCTISFSATQINSSIRTTANINIGKIKNGIAYVIDTFLQTTGITPRTYEFAADEEAVLMSSGQATIPNNIVKYNVQYELASEPTAFEPFSGNVYNISFPNEAGTVYGATLINAGQETWKLKVDKALVTFTGDLSENWSHYEVSTGDLFRISIPDRLPESLTTRNPNILQYMCNSYVAAQNQMEARTSGTFSSGADTTNVDFANNNCNDVASWREYLNSNNIQFVYRLATPVEYTISANAAKTLLGLNNVWANTGNIVKLIYRKTTTSSSEIENTIESMIAGVEQTMEATRNYTTDILVVAAHKLYHITANIASGETLVPGTNCYVTTIANELSDVIGDINSQLGSLGNLSNLTYEVVT